MPLRCGRTVDPVPTPSLDDLRSVRAELLAVTARHGASNLRVFGSCARGDATDGSDIDLLVDLDRCTSLIGLGELEHELSDVVGTAVDRVPASMLKPRIRDRALAEAIAI